MPKEDTWFKPGNTLGGRPKGLERLTREMVDWPKAVEFLIGILYGEAAPGTKVADRLKAFELLSNRAFGQAKQSIDITSDEGQTMAALNMANMTREELRAFELQTAALLAPPRALQVLEAASVDVGAEAHPTDNVGKGTP